jgi:hypothetical protein
LIGKGVDMKITERHGTCLGQSSGQRADER